MEKCLICCVTLETALACAMLELEISRSFRTVRYTHADFLQVMKKYCIGNIKEGVDIRKAKLIAMSNFDKTDPKCKGCTIRDFCHGMKCGYMNFINTGKINVPSDAECIFEHIFYKAMVQILEYYLQQPIEIVREKLGVYIDYIQEEDLKFSEFGEKIAKRLSDER